MGLFSRKNKTAATGETMPSRDITDNPTDRTHQLIGNIVDAMRRADKSCASFTVWAVSDYYASIIRTPEFERQLRTALDNADLTLCGGGTIIMRHAVPADDDKPVDVMASKVFVTTTVSKAADVRASTRVKARVTVLDGTGTLEQPEYVLDSDLKKTYHIGRGKAVRRSDSFRRNDIVIADNEPDETLNALNKHVSGSQADIVYCNSFFGLRAMKGGCRSEGGVATKILRENSVTELTDSNRIHRLENGDMIELGKSVVLQFDLEPVRQ